MAANYSIVIMGSETVIFDAYGNKVISCPTEKEAVEYVNEIEEGDNEMDKIRVIIYLCESEDSDLDSKLQNDLIKWSKLQGYEIVAIISEYTGGTGIAKKGYTTCLDMIDDCEAEGIVALSEAMISDEAEIIKDFVTMIGCYGGFVRFALEGKAEGIDVSALDDSDEDIFENRCTITLL